MHRKLLPVCLEGKYVAIVQQTPSTQKIQKRDLLIVQNIHSQFFVLMLVKRSEYSIIFLSFSSGANHGSDNVIKKHEK